MKFEDLFKEIKATDISENAFVLAGQVMPVVSVKTDSVSNAMLASGGGFALMFRNPCTLLLFPKKRYTLDLIKEKQTYTLSYFDKSYQDQIMYLGQHSGLDSNKMEEVKLNAIDTPLDNLTFEEAFLVIECKLAQIVEPTYPDNFFLQDDIDYLAEPYLDDSEHREYVFGEITKVWVKK